MGIITFQKNQFVKLPKLSYLTKKNLEFSCWKIYSKMSNLNFRAKKAILIFRAKYALGFWRPKILIWNQARFARHNAKWDFSANFCTLWYAKHQRLSSVVEMLNPFFKMNNQQVWRCAAASAWKLIFSSWFWLVIYQNSLSFFWRFHSNEVN